MPSTHSSLIFHVVFSTKEREIWFPPDFRPRLHAYLGVFSVSASGLEAVRDYVLGQEEHHRTRTFQEEYVAMLKKSGAAYDERYLW